MSESTRKILNLLKSGNIDYIKNGITLASSLEDFRKVKTILEQLFEDDIDQKMDLWRDKIQNVEIEDGQKHLYLKLNKGYLDMSLIFKEFPNIVYCLPWEDDMPQYEYILYSINTLDHNLSHVIYSILEDEISNIYELVDITDQLKLEESFEIEIKGLLEREEKGDENEEDIDKEVTNLQNRIKEYFNNEEKEVIAAFYKKNIDWSKCRYFQSTNFVETFLEMLESCGSFSLKGDFSIVTGNKYVLDVALFEKATDMFILAEHIFMEGNHSDGSIRMLVARRLE